MSALIGHEWALHLLLNGLAVGRFSHATLICGPPNIGKTTLARTVAQALNCTGPAPAPCGDCRPCRKVASGNHPDVRVLDAPGQPLKIDQVRELQRELSLSPYEGRWRVAILSDFERATIEAANALLKTLEEPPAYVALLLTATQADLLLPTIVSRCQVLSLRALPINQVREALVSQWEVDTTQAELLAHICGGRLGWAINVLQDREALSRRAEDLDHLLTLLDASRVGRLAYAATLARNPKQTEETLALWMSWWHDILLLKSGAQVALCNMDRSDILHEQAGQVTLSDAHRMVEQIGFVTHSLDQNANLRLAIEVLLLGLATSGVGKAGCEPPDEHERWAHDVCPRGTMMTVERADGDIGGGSGTETRLVNMPEVVGVRFKACTKIYYFSPGDVIDLALTDPVIVETTQGEELGWVAISPMVVDDEEIKGKLKPIIRRATPVDLVTMEEFRARESSTLVKCREKVVEMGLPMKVVRAEYSFDGERLVFSFLAEERVDFRELVRQLARSFRTRIEMKQIGARDEAKLIGGYALCGRQLCCASWLTEFHPVSIKMAKQQDLPLTPTEISGMCGRLLCCLAYENNQYIEIKQAMPKVGTLVATQQGKGTIVSLNVLTETVTVELQSELTVELKPDEVTTLAEQKHPVKARGSGAP